MFCILLVSVATLLLWRRHAKNKALGHSGGEYCKGKRCLKGIFKGDFGVLAKGLACVFMNGKEGRKQGKNKSAAAWGG